MWKFGARAIGAGMPMGTRSCVASDLRCHGSTNQRFSQVVEANFGRQIRDVDFWMLMVGCGP